MTASTDYYALLQVDPRAEKDVIDAAYRRLAAKYHPDVSGARNATEKMVQLNAAHEVLGDPARRAEYDASRTSLPATTGKRRRRRARRGTQVVQSRRITVAWGPSLLLLAAIILATRVFRLGSGETAVILVVVTVLWLLSKKG